eukprot:Nk52_evm14s2474 gene=Nk52_evmTU14s2474
MVFARGGCVLMRQGAGAKASGARGLCSSATRCAQTGGASTAAHRPDFFQRNAPLGFSLIALGVGIQYMSLNTQYKDLKALHEAEKEAVEHELKIYRRALQPRSGASEMACYGSIVDSFVLQTERDAARAPGKQLEWETVLATLERVVAGIRFEAEAMATKYPTSVTSAALPETPTSDSNVAPEVAKKTAPAMI